MTINQFIDVDLLEIPDCQSAGALDGDGELMGDPFGDFEAENLMVPRADWEDLAGAMAPTLAKCVRTVHNQGREGSCVANACCGAYEQAAFIQFGPSVYRELSPMSLYERIGRTAQSGAYIPDGIRELSDRGVLPADNADNRDRYDIVYPPTGFNPRRLARLDWEPVGALFRTSRVLKVNTFDAWISALLRGCPIVYGRQGHAIYSHRPVKDGYTWYAGYVNSWGRSWGDVVNDDVGRGLGYDSERVISRCTGYAIVSVVSRPDEYEV